MTMASFTHTQQAVILLPILAMKFLDGCTWWPRGFTIALDTLQEFNPLPKIGSVQIDARNDLRSNSNEF